VRLGEVENEGKPSPALAWRTAVKSGIDFDALSQITSHFPRPQPRSEVTRAEQEDASAAARNGRPRAATRIQAEGGSGQLESGSRPAPFWALKSNIRRSSTCPRYAPNLPDATLYPHPHPIHHLLTAPPDATSLHPFYTDQCLEPEMLRLINKGINIVYSH